MNTHGTCIGMIKENNLNAAAESFKFYSFFYFLFFQTNIIEYEQEHAKYLAT